MHAAGIVADHSAERAAAVRSRIGTESQVVLLGGIAQMVENDAWLNPCDTPFGIKLDDLRHVLREVEHDSDIAALTGERRASAAAKHRRAMLAANGKLLAITSSLFLGSTTADRDLAIIRAVGRVKGSAAVIESDLAADIWRRRADFKAGVASSDEMRSGIVMGLPKDSIPGMQRVVEDRAARKNKSVTSEKHGGET